MKPFIILIIFILGGFVLTQNDHLIDGRVKLTSTLFSLDGNFSVHIQSNGGLIDTLSIFGNLSIKNVNKKASIREIISEPQSFRIKEDSPILVELQPVSFDEKGGILKVIIFTLKGKKEEVFQIKESEKSEFYLYHLVDGNYEEVKNINIFLRGTIFQTSKIKIRRYEIE